VYVVYYVHQKNAKNDYYLSLFYMYKALKMNIITKVERVYIEQYQFYKIWFENPENFVKISFDMTQWCCEYFEFSSIPTEDNFEKFIGAKIEDVRFEEIDENDYDDDDDDARRYCGCKRRVKVFIKTTVGELFIEMFNEHNGYYTHDYTIEYNYYDSENNNKTLFTRNLI